MKDVCENCRFRKKGKTKYCTKYGIPIWTPKVYCVSKEPERGTEADQTNAGIRYIKSLKGD